MSSLSLPFIAIPFPFQKTTPHSAQVSGPRSAPRRPRPAATAAPCEGPRPPRPESSSASSLRRFGVTGPFGERKKQEKKKKTLPVWSFWRLVLRWKWFGGVVCFGIWGVVFGLLFFLVCPCTGVLCFLFTLALPRFQKTWPWPPRMLLLTPSSWFWLVFFALLL